MSRTTPSRVPYWLRPNAPIHPMRVRSLLRRSIDAQRYQPLERLESWSGCVWLPRLP